MKQVGENLKEELNCTDAGKHNMGKGYKEKVPVKNRDFNDILLF